MIKILVNFPVGCETCRHYNGDVTCRAYPGGIPLPIQSGQTDHREPQKGDQGIQYEPTDEFAMRLQAKGVPVDFNYQPSARK